MLGAYYRDDNKGASTGGTDAGRGIGRVATGGTWDKCGKGWEVASEQGHK